MSVTNRGAQRVDADFYPTQPWVVYRLLEKCPLPVGNWLEPCAGDGAIIKATNMFHQHRAQFSVRNLPNWYAIELREEMSASLAPVPHAICSFLDVTPMSFALSSSLSLSFDVVISNPPFSIAMEVIQHALKFAPWVVMLLRVNFLGSEERTAFFRGNMPDVYQLPNRPSFAQSISCSKKKEGCPFNMMLQLKMEAPKKCLMCGAPVRRSTSDATEYAWFVWPPERNRTEGKIVMLNSTSEEERSAA